MHGLGFSSMFMPKLYFRCPLYGGTGKVYTVDLSKPGYKIFCFLAKEKKYFDFLPRKKNIFFSCQVYKKATSFTWPLWGQGWKKWLEFPNLWGHAIRWTCTQENQFWPRGESGVVLCSTYYLTVKFHQKIRLSCYVLKNGPIWARYIGLYELWFHDEGKIFQSYIMGSNRFHF